MSTWNVINEIVYLLSVLVLSLTAHFCGAGHLQEPDGQSTRGLLGPESRERH